VKRSDPAILKVFQIRFALENLQVIMYINKLANLTFTRRFPMHTKHGGHRSFQLILTPIVFFISLIILISILSSSQSIACTIVISSNEETVLVGNNEDYIDPRTNLWFFPASETDYGIVIWGFDRYLYPYQGGMNDKGLFVDINFVPYTGWQDSPDKPNFDDDPIEKILTNFGSLPEVIEFFEQYDVSLESVKFVVADAQGNSAIFEWLDDRLNIIQKDRHYQISTNYVSPREPTEPRYQTAEKILINGDKPTVDIIRRVLSATSYDVYLNQTLYSTICDLKKRIVHVYHFHNFEEVVTFDLADELQKGEASYAIPDLFEIRPHTEYWFNILGTKIGAKDFMEYVEANGIDEGIKIFHVMREESSNFNRFVFEEWVIRSMGLTYMSNQQMAEAIEVFKLNVEQYPESWETYKDLAEAYLESGSKALAKEYYQKALDINPGDAGIKEALDRL
jgi:tetratricopeptide (TPR) repeat protein